MNSKHDRRSLQHPKARKSGWSKWLKFKVGRRARHPIDMALRKAMAAKQLYNGGGSLIPLSRSEGWARITRGTLPLTEEVVEGCLSMFDRRKPQFMAIVEEKDAKKESYFYDVAGPNGFEGDLELVVDYMTQPAILNCVVRYLGELPIFQGVGLYWTPPNNKSVSSQLWHLDHLDTKQVKFFLYLSDIDEGAGPTTILSIDASRYVAKALQYQGGKLSDEEVASCVPPEKWIPLTGPKGTLIACDTSSCFHFGGRARERERLFLMFHYSTSAPFAFEGTLAFSARSLKERLLFSSPINH